MSPANQARLAAMLRYVQSDDPDLTPRQIAMLMVVAWTPGPHTVRALAETLGVAKPVITRSSNRLINVGLILRRIDKTDRRSVLITPTELAGPFLERSAEVAAAA